MATKKPKSSPKADRELTLTRIFDAPRKLVFAAWTKKEHLARWCAPHGFTIPVTEGELRIGGAWKECMVTPGGEECWLSGKYLEIIENELLVFTHAWEEKGRRGHETVVTVRFADYGKKTRMVFHQAAFESVQSRDGHRSGWSECFDRLANLLAKKKR